MSTPSPPPKKSLGQHFLHERAYIEQLERAAIQKALEDNRWNKTRTAEQLGITFRALRYKLKKLGMD